MNKTLKFEEILVDQLDKDGYWLEAVDVNGDGRADLVASGLARGELCWYENPGWKRRTIAKMDVPVSMGHADIDGDGRDDLVVCHHYGSSMWDLDLTLGKVSWLRNPTARNPEGDWEDHPIAHLKSTHRLRLGHFSQAKRLEVLALPIVGVKGVHEPIHVALFRKPEGSVLDGTPWEEVSVDETFFRMIHHGIHGKFGPASAQGLDAALIASEEGITLLWFEPATGKWNLKVLGTGDDTNYGTTGYKGTGNVHIGRVGSDPCAYLAATEPFHGNVVAVYTKDSDAPLEKANWKRKVLDVYGVPNAKGEGPCHDVIAVDLDGDGDDEFLVGLRGPAPTIGVYLYKCVDARKGIFTKTQISTASASKIVLADFDGDGTVDFATTGYYVPGYYLDPTPQVRVFLNRCGR
ncbi:MAG: VCBS repeat-containing protein [Planctomycetes bacterium]|nr:VCBS repeat-containing protein [Planctomycetota bacterium]